jgi:hypothetical protein
VLLLTGFVWYLRSLYILCYHGNVLTEECSVNTKVAEEVFTNELEGRLKIPGYLCWPLACTKGCAYFRCPSIGGLQPGKCLLELLLLSVCVSFSQNV